MGYTVHNSRHSPGTLNTLRSRRGDWHFADDIFKRIFFNEDAWISINISLKFVPKAQINSIPALAQIMAWRRSGDKPLSEPMLGNLLTYICVTRPQWVNISTTKQSIYKIKCIFHGLYHKLFVMEFTCIRFTFPTRILCQGLSGFVTGCPSDVWWHGLLAPCNFFLFCLICVY